MLPRRVDAGGEVRLPLGPGHADRIRRGQQGVVAERPEPPIQAGLQVLLVAHRRQLDGSIRAGAGRRDLRRWRGDCRSRGRRQRVAPGRAARGVPRSHGAKRLVDRASIASFREERYRLTEGDCLGHGR